MSVGRVAPWVLANLGPWTLAVGEKLSNVTPSGKHHTDPTKAYPIKMSRLEVNASAPSPPLPDNGAYLYDIEPYYPLRASCATSLSGAPYTERCGDRLLRFRDSRHSRMRLWARNRTQSGDRPAGRFLCGVEGEWKVWGCLWIRCPSSGRDEYDVAARGASGSLVSVIGRDEGAEG